MPRRVLVWLMAAMLLDACATMPVTFQNATPGAPRTISAVEVRPRGDGPFPAVVLLHGCHGVMPSTREWASWLRDRGYVALIVDSWTPRGMKEGCTPKSLDIPNTERLDDAMGALRYLQSRPYVDRERVGVMGWSNGGAFAMSVVNGPTLERARARAVVLPEPGYRAAVAFYPGACSSLVREQVVRPLLVLIGAADDWTLASGCTEMVNQMRSRGADASIVVYPGAVHYFDAKERPRAFLADVENQNLPGECCGATVGYDPAADADARRRVEQFFAAHLGRSSISPLGRRSASHLGRRSTSLLARRSTSLLAR
jgi:dienelactone hydrolase